MTFAIKIDIEKEGFIYLSILYIFLTSSLYLIVILSSPSNIRFILFTLSFVVSIIDPCVLKCFKSIVELLRPVSPANKYW